MTDRSSLFDDDAVLDSLRADIVVSGAAAKRRISLRLSSTIDGLSSGDQPATREGGSDASDERGGASLAERAGSPSIVRPGTGLGLARSWLSPLIQRPLALAVASFSIGAASGAAIHAALERPAPTSNVRTAPPRPAFAPPATSASASVLAPRQDEFPVPPALADPSAASARSAPPRPSASRLDGLAAQQALLDQARSALARGDDDAALQNVELHARRYPNSIMIEEREALAIKALVGKGSYVDAKARGNRFRERFPRSLLLSSIEETLATIP